MSQPISRRVRATDDVRVILTLMGIVLHASSLISGAPDGSSEFNIWMWLGSAIHVFRMQAFFALSGYLSWKVMIRGDYITKRTRQILLPTVVMLLTIFPLFTGVSVASFKPSTLWFMITLYMLVVFNTGLWRLGIIDRLKTAVTRYPLICVVLAVILQLILSHLNYQYLVNVQWDSAVDKIVRRFTLMGEYELYYLGGLLLAQLPSWQNSLKHTGWRWVGAGVWVLWMIAIAIVPALSVTLYLSTLVTIPITVGVISLATQSSLNMAWTKPLCPTSMTIYLWHYPIMVLFVTWWGGVVSGYHPVILFVSLCAVAFLGSLAAHWLIMQNGVLRTLFMGEEIPASVKNFYRRNHIDNIRSFFYSPAK